jgi:hypothetical protein
MDKPTGPDASTLPILFSLQLEFHRYHLWAEKLSVRKNLVYAEGQCPCVTMVVVTMVVVCVEQREGGKDDRERECVCVCVFWNVCVCVRAREHVDAHCAH